MAHLGVLTCVCVYSSEQGKKLSEVADKCFQLGETKWKREEWTTMYVRRRREETNCFTVAGVSVTRESAFQATAASALLVFAELASGKTSADSGTGSPVNVTHAR
ncbi:uncharacterized protein LOC129583145 [Paramacrobiotus metropolitanus]|uniref:uncharacterized protein LOC129583145 n=1 Tax=Paramacrobiotus metropolitanus TaxID=2943436 RepID=UPI00244653B4|nr:uncharacterized protein LOC129583145 [Paramacrobiotus metropolitanus]